MFFIIFTVPAVITFASRENNLTHDGIPLPEACRRLEEAGADVVGLNCSRGPATMMTLIKEIKKVCKVSIVLQNMTENISVALYSVIYHISPIEEHLDFKYPQFSTNDLLRLIRKENRRNWSTGNIGLGSGIYIL